MPPDVTLTSTSEPESDDVMKKVTITTASSNP